MERALGQWIDDQTTLLDLERDEEISQLTDRISSLSAKACQSEGLSLLNLEVDSYHTALFGRCSLTLQRVDKQQLVQSFKVGDEVCLYNPKLYGASSSSSNEDALLLGLIGKVSPYKIEMIVDEFDDQLFQPPLRMDLRSSQKTHATMKSALSTMQHEGTQNKLVNLMFNPELQRQQITLSSRSGAQLDDKDLWNPGLNASQRRTIQCALDTPSVAIIHGPPGTGKTSTLTELILQAVNRDMRVLVCAPSNIAVDTILGRLADYADSTRLDGRGKAAAGAGRPALKHGLSMVRLGHPARISEKIMRFALDSIISRAEGTEIVKDVRQEIDALRSEMGKKGKRRANKGDGPEVSFAQQRREQRQELRALCKEASQRERAVVADVLRRANVVLATCVGAGSRLLREAEFDLVVIDEAAQGLEAACWIPILKMREAGGRCVLAGDHCQLPPTIKSAVADKGGLSVTLFERIIKDSRFRDVVCLLDTQYRMNRRISDWASHNMYHDAIRSDPSVAEHTLRDILPGGRANSSASSAEAGETGTVPEGDEPEDVYPVMLLVDTSGLGMFEDSTQDPSAGSGVAGSGKKLGSSHRNFHEAELVKQHVLSLVRSGVEPSQIGVITPYNGQLEVLRELLFPSSDVDRGDTAAIDAKGGDNKKPAKLLPVKNKPKVQNPLAEADGSGKAGFDVNLEGLEIKTIDGFQGGEKECILLSLVRSNATHTVGFLGERRRINVAVTRAKRHLAVFCDADTCSVDPFMCTLIEHMVSEGDHISAEEYLDYVAAGGYGACAHGSSVGTSKTKFAPSRPNAKEASKELKKLTSTIEKADFLRAMEKLKGGDLLPAEASKNAVVNVIIPEPVPEGESQSPPADAEAKETVTARLYCATGVLRFPASMNSYLRMVVHECAEQLGLQHRSVGDGADRWIEVCAGEFPAESEGGVGAAKKKGKASKAASKVDAGSGSGVGPTAPTAPPTPSAPAIAPVPVDTAAHKPEPAPAPAPAPPADHLEGSNGSSDSEDGGLQGKTSATKPAGQKRGRKKASAAKKGPEGAYMGADRRSALGRLEAQQEAALKQAALADDEDALLEAAIAHNQKVAELHKYRVTGTAAMPNPDKVTAKQKLQQKMAEAAQARSKATGDAPASGTKGPAAGGGAGGGPVGRLGGNVFGFVGGSSTAGTGIGGGGSAGGSGGSGGGKKKVVKKPPSNFGGGVLGGK